MPLEDRHKLKRLTKVYIKCTSLTTSGTVNVKYGYDTNGSQVDLINESVTSLRPKYYEASSEVGGNPLAESRDFAFQVTLTGQIDAVELGMSTIL